ncbi:hypothetical protein RF55_13993 [Lasius niger]|uniref:Uncharacterized protein n=1 Tax=Lasius niger TaxID=67767 RepID=A0A0J7K989_LASNI|nr:hypothetical protein RF55_13993 [Lasius niger]
MPPKKSDDRKIRRERSSDSPSSSTPTTCPDVCDFLVERSRQHKRRNEQKRTKWEEARWARSSEDDREALDPLQIELRLSRTSAWHGEGLWDYNSNVGAPVPGPSGVRRAAPPPLPPPPPKKNRDSEDGYEGDHEWEEMTREEIVREAESEMRWYIRKWRRDAGYGSSSSSGTISWQTEREEEEQQGAPPPVDVVVMEEEEEDEVEENQEAMEGINTSDADTVSFHSSEEERRLLVNPGK